jgi:ABC-type Na+ efflux pump permease subunit
MFFEFGIHSFYKSRYLVLLVMVVAGVSAMPASADTSAVPSLPLILEGSVSMGDEEATAGTEITAELDGEVIGSTTIDSDGVYGDQPSTKLVVTCESEDYEHIKFYVNGVESEISGADFSSSNPGDTVSLDLSVPASSDSGTDDSSKGSSSSGSSGSSGALSSSSSTSSAEDEDVNIANENENGELESTVDDVPVSSGGETPAAPKDTSAMFSTSGMTVAFLVTLVVLLGVMKIKGRK